MNYEIPFEKFNCDTKFGDGQIFFFDEYLVWKLKGDYSEKQNIEIRYKDVKDVKVYQTRKKTIQIQLKNGTVKEFYLYKDVEFMRILTAKVNGADLATPVVETKAAKEESGDDLEKLERLAKLHQSGALSDEEFKAAKKKILGL